MKIVKSKCCGSDYYVTDGVGRWKNFEEAAKFSFSICSKAPWHACDKCNQRCALIHAVDKAEMKRKWAQMGRDIEGLEL